LRNEGVLIVGSGMSYHNMRGFGSQQGASDSDSFDCWLNQAIGQPNSRDATLMAWETAPAARAAHPREEHLIPLMVAAGAAGNAPAKQIFSGRPMGVAVSAFRFGV